MRFLTLLTAPQEHASIYNKQERLDTSPNDATATVYVIFRDNAGNESSVSDTIIHDDQAPTGATISIAGPLLHLNNWHIYL